MFPVGLLAGLNILFIKSTAAACAYSRDVLPPSIIFPILPEVSITSITSNGLSGAIPVIDNSTSNLLHPSALWTIVLLIVNVLSITCCPNENIDVSKNKKLKIPDFKFFVFIFLWCNFLFILSAI